MTFTWRRAALIAALIFLALFLIHYFSNGPNGNFQPLYGGEADIGIQRPAEFELNRKNYASGKSLIGFGGGGGAVVPVGGASPEQQKYEKIGSLMQLSEDFDADRKKIDGLIATNAGIVQQERAVGLKGHRAVQLGIGVPPDKFDAFIEAARGIGKSVNVEIVKNDKTNEYLQLRAKRQTLEKARTALEELRAGGGSTEERVTVQNRLTEIEQQIQDLGVSLGEFDSQNELCTVKLSLRERVVPVKWSLARRVWRAFQVTLTDYLMLGLGFFGLMAGLWVGTLALREGLKIWASYGKG